VIDRDLTDVFIHTTNPAWLLAHGLFVTEGRHCTRRLLVSGRFKVVALLLTPTAEAALADVIGPIPPAERPPIIVKSQADLDALTTFRLHQGCVAYAERVSPSAWQPEHTLGGLSVLLERVRDPDNVGSIARSASAMGVQALLMGPECADPFYRKAVRTSMGAVLTQTIVDASPWPGVLDALKASGHTLIATTPDPAAIDIGELHLASDFIVPSESPGFSPAQRSLILMVGSEGEGLSPDALKAADIHARIPMTTAVDSLNVGVATAVAVYALSRGIG